MGHGNEEGILGIDGRPIPVEEMTAIFHSDICPQLVNKPKLFFLLGSQYVYSYKRVPHFEMPVNLPLDVDFLIVYPASYYSARSEVQTGSSLGSRFLSLLVQVFRASSRKEDLMTMLTRVNKAMSERGSHQVSCQLSTLSKKVFFPKPDY